MSDAPSPDLARHILARVGESGQPPEMGVQHLNVGNERILGVLDQEYLGPIARSGRGSSFKLVQAYYGGGKTHFLMCMRHLAWQHHMASALVSLSPQECPFDDPFRIYQGLARELTWPSVDPEVAPARGIEHALRAALEERDKESLKIWLQGALRRTPVDSPSYRAAMVAFVQAWLDEDLEKEELLAAYLRGEEVQVSEVRSFGVREAITRENGFRMVRSLVQLLQAFGAPGLLLCFDEVDRTLSLGPKRRRAVADNLRQLIDLCGREALPGLFCLYAVPPEFMREVVTEYPALQQRLEGPSVLSERSPQAAVIDLERLDIPDELLLSQIGQKLLGLAKLAWELPWSDTVQRENLNLLAKEVVASSLEVAHRRQYVKTAVHLLQDQRSDQRRLGTGEIRILLKRAVDTATPAGFEEF